VQPEAQSEDEEVGRQKSERLREALVGMIRSLPEGASLPTERELCATHRVSRSTVRVVLGRLEAEQRIYRRQGKGTFVARAKLEQRLGLTSHTEEMRANGILPGSKLINVTRIPADGDIASALRLSGHSEVLRIERLRLADGEPIAIEVLYLNAERFDGISAALDDNVSFYQLLHSDYGVELATAEETIEAVVAGAGEAHLLGSNEGAALLQLSRLTLDTYGRPIEYVRSLYRGDRFRFRQHLERRTSIPASGLPRLRRATRRDARALASVFVGAWKGGAYNGVVDAGVLEALDERNVTDWLGNLVASSEQETYLAESPVDEIVGFIRFGDDPGDTRIGHVYALYVHPEATGRGIGRRLLEVALEKLGARGQRAVTLWVFEENHRARRFYSAAGFAPDGARRVEAEYGAQEIRLMRPASEPDADGSEQEPRQGEVLLEAIGG